MKKKKNLKSGGRSYVLTESCSCRVWTACRGTSVIPALHTEVRPWGWSHDPPPVLPPSLGQGPAILPAGLISVALAFFLHLSLICPCPSVHRKRFPRCCRDHTVGIKSGDGGWCSRTVPNALHSRSHLILSTTLGIKHYYNPHSQTRELGSGKGRNSLCVRVAGGDASLSSCPQVKDRGAGSTPLPCLGEPFPLGMNAGTKHHATQSLRFCFTAMHSQALVSDRAKETDVSHDTALQRQHLKGKPAASPAPCSWKPSSFSLDRAEVALLKL